MDNNKKIKELKKQIEELKKNQDGLYRCIEEVRNDLIDTNLMSVLNKSRIKVINNKLYFEKNKLKQGDK